MENINENPLRVGNFTSSEIVALTKTGKGEDFGQVAKTYIQECNFERKLGRPISEEINSKPLVWGKLLEKRAFDLLGIEYVLSSQDTIKHPVLEYWCGSPDGIKVENGVKTVIDIKCPFTLKSFCQLYECNTIIDLIKNHKDGEKYYWQLVSNAILTDSNFAELIVYMPYKSELEDIREMAQNYDGNQNKLSWINWATDEELPHLIDGGFYKNIHIIKFSVNNTDTEFLINRVIEAKKLLIDYAK